MQNTGLNDQNKRFYLNNFTLFPRIISKLKQANSYNPSLLLTGKSLLKQRKTTANQIRL